MNRRLTLVIAVLLGLSSLSSVAVAQQKAEPSSDPAPLERMPKDLEIRFALSAVPQHLHAEATVYLLDPATGYVPDRNALTVSFLSIPDWP